MAFLSTRVNGTSQGTIDANWYNDFMQVLTGAMNDQPIFIYYEPSAGSNPPALKLQTNGNADLLQAYNSGGTEVFSVDSSGIAHSYERFEWDMTLGGSNQIILKIAPPDGTNTYGLNYNTDATLNIYNYTTSTNLFKLDSSGNLVLAGSIESNLLEPSTAGTTLAIQARGSGAAAGVYIRSWDGAAVHHIVSFGGQYDSALSYFDNSGNLFGQAVHVAGSLFGSGGVLTIGDKIHADGGSFTSDGAGNLTATSFIGALTGTATNATNVGTIRNGTTTDVPIYTGTNTPSSPATGAIWIKA
jgi:hypothetical protein